MATYSHQNSHRNLNCSNWDRRASSLSVLGVALLVASMAQPACGGTRARDVGTTPGQSHEGNVSPPASTSEASSIENELDSSSPGMGATSTSTSTSDLDAGAFSAPALVTFVIKNEAEEDLFLNMDKGWQAVIYAYSGTPPKAKSMLMFPTFCTASCDSDAQDLCPVCPEPQRVADIKAAENHDAVAPGDSREVPWDGMAFSSKKTKKGTRDGRRASCNCYDKVEAVPETYTIRACGLRKTQSAKVRSRYPCVEGQLTLPVSEAVRVELTFRE